jgi:hypothetical protein
VGAKRILVLAGSLNEFDRWLSENQALSQRGIISFLSRESQLSEVRADDVEFIGTGNWLSSEMLKSPRLRFLLQAKGIDLSMYDEKEGPVFGLHTPGSGF